MKVDQKKQYIPILITLETEKEAQELLGILQKVELVQPGIEGNPQHSFRFLRETLHSQLGVPMTGLYDGNLRRVP